MFTTNLQRLQFGGPYVEVNFGVLAKSQAAATAAAAAAAALAAAAVAEAAVAAAVALLLASQPSRLARRLL